MSQALNLDTAALADAGADAASIEAAARARGWKSADEFANGPPANFVDAATFLRNSDNDVPLLRTEVQKLRRQNDRLRRDAEETKGLVVTISDNLRRADERAYAKARRDLEAEKTKAVQAGDVDAVARVDKDIAELKPPAPPAAPPPPAAVAPPAAPPPTDPVIVDWIKENPWFNTDAVCAREADAQHKVLLQTNPEMTLEENLAEVARRVRSIHPQRFPAQRRPAGLVNGSSPDTAPAPQGQRGRSFADLPRDAQQQYHRYKKMLEGKGKPLTEQEWCDSYDWS